jgi:hypothetical protein
MSDEFLSTSYPIANLIYDGLAIKDRTLQTLTDSALSEAVTYLEKERFGLTPFPLLGKLLLGFISGGDKSEIPKLANRIIDEEARLRHECYWSSNEFIWGLTTGSSKSVWAKLVKKYFPTDYPDETVQLLRTFILH